MTTSPDTAAVPVPGLPAGSEDPDSPDDDLEYAELGGES
jgi:hypothetical protein